LLARQGGDPYLESPPTLPEAIIRIFVGGLTRSYADTLWNILWMTAYFDVAMRLLSMQIAPCTLFRHCGLAFATTRYRSMFIFYKHCGKDLLQPVFIQSGLVYKHGGWLDAVM
jgi:hypothetical protein